MIDKLTYASDTPEIMVLIDELRRSATDSGIFTRIRDVENTRYNRWDGQSEDGKKWNENLANGKQAFPWDGASDTRIALADEVINSLVDLQTTSFWKSTIRVGPVESQDFDKSAVMQTILDWLINTKMYSELTREVELLAQYVWTYGWSAIHVTWQQESGLKNQHLTEKDVVQMAMQSPAGSILAELPHLIVNPNADDQTAELMLKVFPHLKKKRAKQAIRDLRETGECDFPIPAVTKNVPNVAALMPYDEICFPPETTDVQSARIVFRRVYITEEQLRATAQAEGWDQAWVDQTVQTAGQFTNWNDITAVHGIGGALAINPIGRRTNLIEITYAYVRQLDEDDVPGIWCTVFSPFNGDTYAKHEVLDYAHGQYPFVAFRSEFIHRKVIESRGVPEIVSTWQSEIKVQRDSIVDYTSINTLPPVQVPMSRAANLKIAPASQMPVIRQGEIKFMDVPEREPTVAFKLIETIWAQTDRYYGRPTEVVSPILTQMRQQRLVNTWLHGWSEAFRQMLVLCTQFLEPEEIQRVTKTNITLSPDDAQYDLILKFDVRELSEDFMTKKLEAITSLVVPGDVSGVIDRSKLTVMQLRAIDPMLASELTVDKASASKQMFDSVQKDIAFMFLGNKPQLVENDPTAATKLQFAQSIIGENPKYQDAIGKDQIFQELLKQYTQNLQFSVQQQQNAMIGRIGVNPENPAQQMQPAA